MIYIYHVLTEINEKVRKRVRKRLRDVYGLFLCGVVVPYHPAILTLLLLSSVFYKDNVN